MLVSELEKDAHQLSRVSLRLNLGQGLFSLKLLDNFIQVFIFEKIFSKIPDCVNLSKGSEAIGKKLGYFMLIELLIFTLNNNSRVGCQGSHLEALDDVILLFFPPVNQKYCEQQGNHKMETNVRT